MTSSSSASQLGPFWIRKMKTQFCRIDADGDGIITLNDFDVIADRWIEIGQLKGEKANDLKESYRQVYKEYYNAECCPTNFDQSLQYRKEQTEANKDTHIYTYPRLFSIIDTDKDGIIGEKEFSVFYKAYGISEEIAKESFRHLDTDQDGKMSRDEFLKASSNFYSLETEGDPSQYLWGPLVTE